MKQASTCTVVPVSTALPDTLYPVSLVSWHANDRKRTTFVALPP